MRDRQLCMVAYLFELGYDLMISPKFNLSRMPGFDCGLPACPWLDETAVFITTELV